MSALKTRIRGLVEAGLASMLAEHAKAGGGDAPALDALFPDGVPIGRAREAAHGDYTCAVAMGLARTLRQRPRDIAEALVRALPPAPEVERIEIAGPGFINFHLLPAAYQGLVPEILAAGTGWGRGEPGSRPSVQVEFVSANPTGPLHVGHGRGAAYGDALANLLDAIGHPVQREYYVNDAGRQMDILAVSVWIRYLELCGEPVHFPSAGYRGSYVVDLAEALHRSEGERLRRPLAERLPGLPADAGEGGDGPPAEPGDADAHIDALVATARELLGPDAWALVFDFARERMVEEIREDLEAFGVRYDEWFSERSLVEGGALERAIAALREKGYAYEHEGALWFRSTEFGDEKDRVLVRENGQSTYFASDVAYHLNKIERGFERLIDVWGADHHGYIARVRGAIAALGHPPQRLEVLLVQFANLWRGGERIPMSTRSGEFVTLRSLREEVGRDAARFFYVLRKSDQHLDFDLDLARARSTDNPVYYVQYAHARVCSVWRQLEEKGLEYPAAPIEEAVSALTLEHETELLKTLARYPEVLEAAGEAHEPHQLAHYLRELAHAFHTYYNAHPFLVPEGRLRTARLALVEATRIVLEAGLSLLGVGAPRRM